MTRPWIDTLNPRQRLQLANAVDGIFGHLKLIEKADTNEKKLFGNAANIKPDEKSAIRVEQALTNTLLSAWDDQSRAGIQLLSGALDAWKGPITADNIKGLVQIADGTLGTGFAHKTSAEVCELVGAAYLLGRKITGLEIGIRPNFELADLQAFNVLGQHAMFWIGNYYSSSLGHTIASAVMDLALKQGLGRAEVGRELETKLGHIFKDKGSAYWKGLAATTVTRARALGGVQSMIEAEVEDYEIIAMGDERMCPLCGHMHGKVFRVEDAAALRDAMLTASNPEEIKQLHPWLKLEAVEGWDENKLASEGLSLPPYHFNCRCTYVVHRFSKTIPVQVAFDDIEPESVIPKPEDLVYSKSGQYLGGAGRKSIYVDAAGNEYIFKPAESKSGVPEAFRAHAQEATAQLAARIMDTDRFVEIKTMNLGGEFGTVQQLLPDVVGDLKKIDWKGLGPSAWEQILRESVVDWTVGNFDSHAGNFILLNDGRILGIDKEQAFRYIKDPASQKMSLNYHPNAKYGEQEPLYNTIFRAFAKGQIDLDLQTVLPYLQRLERITDDEYREMLRPYAEELFASEPAQKDFLDRALKRKDETRAVYREFFTKLLKERDKSFKGSFKFLDEMTGTDMKAAPIATQLLGKPELEAMKLSDLKSLAKAHNLPYVCYMNKGDLVEALAKPSEAERVGLEARERYSQNRANARAKGKQPTQPEPANVFQNFGGLKRDGVIIRGDGDMVEGQRVHIAPIKVDGQAGYELSMKVTADYHDTVRRALENAGGRTGSMEFSRAVDTAKGLSYDTGKQIAALPATVLNGKAEVAFCDARANRAAYHGTLRMRIMESDGQKAAEAADDLLRKLGLEKVKEQPDAGEDARYRYSRLAWQHAPKEEIQARSASRTAAGLAELCRHNGIDPKRAEKLQWQEIAPGYATLVEPGIHKTYAKLGVKDIFMGVNRAGGVVSIAKSGYMLSTSERTMRGMAAKGASEGTDVKTGGADYVFTRLIVQSAKGWSYSDAYMGSGYRLHIDLTQLDRKDWFAYPGDEFGKATGPTFERRDSAEGHIQSLMRDYRPNNEIMFQKAIPWSAVTRMTVDNDYKRREMLDEFKKAGMTEINGQRIEDFVQVERTIK